MTAADDETVLLEVALRLAGSPEAAAALLDRVAAALRAAPAGVEPQAAPAWAPAASSRALAGRYGTADSGQPAGYRPRRR